MTEQNHTKNSLFTAFNTGIEEARRAAQDATSNEGISRIFHETLNRVLSAFDLQNDRSLALAVATAATNELNNLLAQRQTSH